VEGEGVVVAVGSNDSVTLSTAAGFASVQILGPSQKKLATLPAIGARVWVTGIFLLHRIPSLGLHPSEGGYHLLVRSDEDITLLEAPPWWTPGRVKGALWVAVLAGGFAGLWIAVLQWRVKRQVATIRKQLAKEAVHDERIRIAQEFHDVLEQHLTGLRMQLGALVQQLPARPLEACRTAEIARKLAELCHEEARRSIFEMRSEALLIHGLTAALRTSLTSIPEGHTPVVEVSNEVSKCTMSASQQHHVLRIAQEAVTNAVKHAKPKKIKVRLGEDGDHLIVSICDDGDGFVPGGVPDAARPHFGLVGMRERVAKMNGIFDVQSSPGKGTSIFITIPHVPPARVA
jgi:signal transduction histidine kinase